MGNKEHKAASCLAVAAAPDPNFSCTDCRLRPAPFDVLASAHVFNEEVAVKFLCLGYYDEQKAAALPKGGAERDRRQVQDARRRVA